MSALGADDYAASFVASLDVYSALRPRTMQTGLGVSDLGYCRAKTLHKLNEVVATESPITRHALGGVAWHEVIGAARRLTNPDLLIECPVKVTLPSGLVIPGNADEINPDEPSVTDYKTVGSKSDLVALRRSGSDEQQQWQRQLYYLGAIQAGLVPPQGTVRNVWMDRAGQSEEPYVEQEPFDMAYVHAADQWLSDILYAQEHGEEVLRDKHYEHCRMFCEFFSHCRNGTDHADLVVTDTELLTAAEQTYAGRQMEREGKALVDSGKRVLSVLQIAPGDDMVAYLLGEHRVRWSWVHQKEGPGYPKLAVEKVED